MVQNISDIILDNEKRLRGMPFFPRSSYGRSMLREDGGPNSDFLTYLFCDRDLGVQFLQDVGLIRSKVLCNTCGRKMKWSAESNATDGFSW
jgi:hypothetical protein